MIKRFDEDYMFLEAMYEDDYYPDFLVNKIKELIIDFVEFIESDDFDKDEVQDKLDEFTISINELEDDFEESESEIEAVAAECIAENIEYILKFFNIDIDVETALRERSW